MKALPKARIERVTQYSLNGQRWKLDLDCGHVEWVTGKKRPIRQFISCGECQKRAGRPLHGREHNERPEVRP